ncbi:MAG: 16S rRNA (cytidine(1402)-2'-O)-methyltransferase [Erysipelotrichales bacterium]|nr:16S rRNA (cytidine(1402)-2'-O)-methyltransferase [Erysipelotrichales bacterium]
MQRQKSFEGNSAVLYLVATPIGNLEELTPRAIEILKSVDVIAAEDTRNTVRLLSHFDIKTKLIAHHEFNEQQSSHGIVELLEQGKSVALVSDAGYPCISDPGAYLVKSVSDAGYPVVPISGANACLAALVASGITPQPYMFYGFLDAKESKRKEQLTTLEPIPYTIVFYEAPHRIAKTLTSMLEVLGDRNICLARELTKLHEEFIRGKISEVLEIVDTLKGEMVVVVEGKSEKPQVVTMSMISAKVDEYISNGMSASAAIKCAAKDLNISKNEVYRIYHQA